MLLFALGMIVGLLFNIIPIIKTRNKLKEVQEQQKLIFDRELGDRISQEEFEKLAHAVYALKELKYCRVIDKDNSPQALKCLEDADKVILENKFCPSWYRS